MNPNWLVRVLVRAMAVAAPLVAGRAVFYNDVSHFYEVGRQWTGAHWPYRDFLWEFPPLTVPVLGLARALADERAFGIALVLTMVLLEVAALVRLRRLARDAAASVEWFWTFTAVPLCAIAYFRLDLIVVFFAVFALAALLDHRRLDWSAVAGFAAKLWPIVFAVPLLLQRRYAAASTVLLGSAAVLVAWYAYSPHGLVQFFAFRKGDGFQVESLPGAMRLAEGAVPFQRFGAFNVSEGALAGFGWIALAVLVGVTVVLTLWGLRRPFDLVAFTAALVLLLILTSRLLSPQYLLWLVPFCALLWGAHRVQGLLLAAATVATLVVLTFYEELLAGSDALAWLLVARNAVLVVLFVELVRIAVKGPVATTEVH